MGHIHVGYDGPNDNTSLELIKYLDLYLGVPAMLMDNDDERKKIYGTAGRFRICKFGFEYRTLSNFWLSSVRLQHWVFNAVHEAINAYHNKVDIETNQGLILATINNNNKVIAKQLCDEYNLTLIKTNVYEKEKNRNYSMESWT